MPLQIMQRQNEIFPVVAPTDAGQLFKSQYIFRLGGPRDVRSPFSSPPPPPPTSAPVPGWCFSVTKCKPASRFISLRADWICDGRRCGSCLKEANTKLQDMIMHASVIIELIEGQCHIHTHIHTPCAFSTTLEEMPTLTKGNRVPTLFNLSISRYHYSAALWRAFNYNFSLF